MKANLEDNPELNNPGILLIAESRAEKDMLKKLWINGCDTPEYSSGTGKLPTSLVIAPKLEVSNDR